MRHCWAFHKYFCKYKIISFYLTQDFIMFDDSLDGLHLDRVNQIIDLGFFFVPSLNFCSRNDYIVSIHRTCILGFIWRNSVSFNSPKCLSVLYCALVRLILEYGAIVWFSYAVGDSIRVDKVQNRFLNYAGYCLSIVHPPHSYQSIDEVLCLESLSTRRQTLRYRFISGLLNG